MLIVEEAFGTTGIEVALPFIYCGIEFKFFEGLEKNFNYNLCETFDLM